jgi:acetoacetyl-CoA reductase
MNHTLEGRVALVTGGTGAIGTAICKRLAASGARVVATYRDQAKADRWVADRKKEGLEIAAVEVDVTSFDSCQAMLAEVEEKVGPIDILVNNAGVTRDTTFRKMSKDQWDCVLTSNLDSLFNVTRNVIGGMMERGYGRVINISSINGEKGQFGQVNYSAAKAGMQGFTKTLAIELGQFGITANAVAPGFIVTDMTAATAARIGMPFDDFQAAAASQIPVRRVGQPEDVAHVIAFLCSEGAGFVSGQVIYVAGGPLC